MSKIFIKPAPGLKVRDPETKEHLPENGANVVKSPFWIRRIKDGDVVLAEVAQPKEIKKEEKINLKQGDK